VLAVAAAALAATLCSVPAAVAQTPAAATISPPGEPTFTALAFPAPAAGWVLGQTAAGGRAAVWHTATAGATWQEQWQGAGRPLSITAADQAHAWALIACPAAKGHPAPCGRELLATADGGRHWRVAATLRQAVNQVQFASARLGVATSDACLVNLGQSRCPGQILLSRDGGARWTTVLRADAPVFATVTATGRLWAAEITPSVFGKNGPSPSAITFTTSVDSGHSWHRLGRVTNLGALTGEVKVSLAATASGGLTWASVFDPLSCAMHGCGVADLLRSGTGGRTWRPAALADIHPDDCASDGIVFSAAPDGSTWAAQGRNGAACAPPLGLLYRHGAAGWQELPPWPLDEISSLSAVSQSVAYAISDRGVLLVTHDGGAHWTQLLPAPAPAGLVDAVSARTALAAQEPSDAGAILRSDDGGRSWRQVAELPGVVTQLDFWSASDGIAASYQAGTSAPWQLWATSDGGANWAPDGPLPGGSTTIYGPWMSANGHGLLLTVAGGTPWQASGGLPPIRIWTTSDSGVNWTRGALLPFGRDSLAGPASFAPYPGSVPGGPARWSGWLVIDTASYAQRVAVTDGGALSLLPATVPAGTVQLLSPRAGLAWSLNYPNSSSAAVVSLARTTDSGRRWQTSSVRLAIPDHSLAVPLLDFTDVDHGWLVLGNATWHTADGGRTWTRA
jgi:photosystem II stability/assembly factor-like uncharacterized protein